MALTLIVALALAAPQAVPTRVVPKASAPTPRRGPGKPAARRKPAPHPHCDGELPDGRVASAGKPVWGAFCRVTFS